MDGDEALTVDEAARFIGRSANTVRRLISTGELAAQRIQGARSPEYRISLRDAEDMRERLRTREATHQRARIIEGRVSESDSAARQDAHSPERDQVDESLAIIPPALQAILESMEAARVKLEEVARAKAEEAATERTRAQMLSERVSELVIERDRERTLREQAEARARRRRWPWFW